MFFDLSYVSSIDVRHCLDVMHVEKNVCDSLIGSLINITNKTKYNKNSFIYGGDEYMITTGSRR